MPPSPTPAVPDEEAPDAAPVPPATDHPPDAAADAAANAALEVEVDADQAAEEAAERRRHWEAMEDDEAWPNAHPAPDLALGLREGVKDFLKGLWG